MFDAYPSAGKNNSRGNKIHEYGDEYQFIETLPVDYVVTYPIDITNSVPRLGM